MGADLILAYAEVPKPFTEGTIGELRLLAGSPPPEIFEAVVEGCGLEMEDDAAQLREDVTDRLKAAVDTVFVEFRAGKGLCRKSYQISDGLVGLSLPLSTESDQQLPTSSISQAFHTHTHTQKGAPDRTSARAIVPSCDRPRFFFRRATVVRENIPKYGLEVDF